MSPDHIDETLNIEFSRQERMFRDRVLLITAGLHPIEADTIVRQVAEDRAAAALNEIEAERKAA